MRHAGFFILGKVRLAIRISRVGQDEDYKKSGSAVCPRQESGGG